MNLDDRTSVSIIIGALGGTAIWLGHAATKSVGIPRLLAYMALAGIATYLVDFVTEQMPEGPVRWTGQMNEPR